MDFFYILVHWTQMHLAFLYIEQFTSVKIYIFWAIVKLHDMCSASFCLDLFHNVCSTSKHGKLFVNRNGSVNSVRNSFSWFYSATKSFFSIVELNLFIQICCNFGLNYTIHRAVYQNHINKKVIVYLNREGVLHFEKSTLKKSE